MTKYEKVMKANVWVILPLLDLFVPPETTPRGVVIVGGNTRLRDELLRRSPSDF